MNKKLILPVVAVAALLGGGLLWLRAGRAPTNELTLHGNVDIRQAELAFETSGRIAAIEVQEGDRVNVGRTLARLDTERLRQALQRAEAQAAAQR